MMYEYTSISTQSMSLPEVMTTMNELGEEGYRLVPQSQLAVMVFERDITLYEYSDGESVSGGTVDRNYYAYASLLLMSAIVFLLVVGLVLWSVHWLR